MKVEQQFTVLGAGAWGSALAIHLANSGHSVCLWGHKPGHLAQLQRDRQNQRYLPGIAFPEQINIEPQLPLAISQATWLLIAVPSHGFAELLQHIQPQLSACQIQGIIWASKGLDPASGRWLSEIAADILPQQLPLGLLSGPSFAKEVAKGLPTAISLASVDHDFLATIIPLWHRRRFRVYHNTDVIGTQLGGAVKNVLAIAAGISDGLGYGVNARAGLITRGLAEMQRLGQAVGAQPSTLLGLAGLGDLILTCTDDQSRNRRFGLQLAQGMAPEPAMAAIGQVVEGAQTARQISQLARVHQVEVPITFAIEQVLDQQLSVKDAVNQLMDRPPRDDGIF